jgi:hypothetical protein
MFHTMPVIGALFAQGHTDTGEPTIIVTAETPTRLQGFPSQVSKEVLERFHLDSYSSDHLLHTGEPPFENVRRGDEPPDFYVGVAEGKSVALDCVAYADHHRRNGYRLMEHLRGRLLAGAGGRDFSGIAGCVLSFWFGPHLDDLPPKRWDDTLVEPLLDAMAGCSVDREAVARVTEEIAAQGGFPQTMPPVVETRRLADDAAGFVVNVVLPLGQTAPFSTGLGFDIELSLPAQVTVGDLFDQLARLINKHDQASIQHLLVTAGGPDVRGYRFPGEEATAAFLLQEHPDLQTDGGGVGVSNLHRITVHLWAARRFIDLPLTRRHEVQP